MTTIAVSPKPGPIAPAAKKVVPPASKSKPRKGEMEPFTKFIFALCAVTLVWIVITTFSPKPVGLLRKDKWLCPRPTVRAFSMRDRILVESCRSYWSRSVSPLFLFFP